MMIMIYGMIYGKDPFSNTTIDYYLDEDLDGDGG